MYKIVGLSLWMDSTSAPLYKVWKAWILNGLVIQCSPFLVGRVAIMLALTEDRVLVNKRNSSVE